MNETGNVGEEELSGAGRVYHTVGSFFGRIAYRWAYHVRSV